MDVQKVSKGEQILYMWRGKQMRKESEELGWAREIDHDIM